MNQWKALAGRIILFPAAPMFSAPLSAHELYRSVWGGEPESFQKPANPLAPAVAQGKCGDMTAVCSTHPMRVDFSLSPATLPPDEGVQTSLRLIEDAGQFRAGLQAVIEAIGRGAVSGGFTRVALNVQFLSLKENFAEANKALAPVIPGQYGVRIADEEDFIFQINQPYQSRKAREIKMNAITKWSVDRIQVLTFAVQAGGGQAPTLVSTASMIPRQEAFTAASVSFDFNNVPVAAENPLSAASQSSLLSEALIATAQSQQEIGLDVEGFQNA